MKRINLKTLIGTMVLIVLMMSFVGCGNKQESSTSEEKGVSGTITSLGSSALQPLVQESAKNFQKNNPDSTINVQGGGSGAGINQVAEGSIDIGNSDVEAELKLKNKSVLKELVDHKVCAIGFGIVVNKDIKIHNLTTQQIQDIFTGKITNWKEVSGQDMPIRVINRPKSSGTRATFKKAIMNRKDTKEEIGTTQDSSGSVVKAVENTKGSISYVAISYLTDTVKEKVKLLNIDGIEANNENIVSWKYKFWAYEHMYTKGKPGGLTKAFLDYMVSYDNKELIKKLGYIPMKDFK